MKQTLLLALAILVGTATDAAAQASFLRVGFDLEVGMPGSYPPPTTFREGVGPGNDFDGMLIGFPDANDFVRISNLHAVTNDPASCDVTEVDLTARIYSLVTPSEASVAGSDNSPDVCTSSSTFRYSSPACTPGADKDWALPGITASPVSNYIVAGSGTVFIDIVATYTSSCSPAQETVTYTTQLSVGAAPLPVELSSFSARPAATGNVIEWTVASEQDLYMYTVESAATADGAFARLADVAPRGVNGAIEAIYSAEDHAPARVNYYRLRAQDLDGSVAYSKVVAVTRAGASAGGFALAPNPAQDRVVVDFGSTPSTTDRTITVTDATGRVVLTRRVNAGVAQLELAVEVLAAGHYVLTVADGEQLWSRVLQID